MRSDCNINSYLYNNNFDYILNAQDPATLVYNENTNPHYIPKKPREPKQFPRGGDGIGGKNRGGLNPGENGLWD